MSADDQCGIGAGLLALGLAAGAILLAQILPNGLIVLQRDLVVPEAVFDTFVCATCLPAGIYFLRKGFRSGNGAEAK